MKELKKLFPIVFLLMASVAWAAPEESENKTETATPKRFPDLLFSLPEAEQDAMDIHPSRYANFWRKWHFVTVRWRQDIREFRYTFANDLAWKTLSEHRTDYPVGAMFGKLIYPAEEDLALPSSVLPSNHLNRLEVILWDPANKKASSDGWVYERFIDRDPQTPQDKDSTGIWGVMSDKEIKSCVECHTRAADRGFVFSQPAYLFRDPSNDDEDVAPKKVSTIRLGDSMKEMALSEVPRITSDLMESLPAWKGRKIKALEGDFFSGALGEAGPVLAKLAQQETDTMFLIFDRDDPNTLEIASSINKKDHDHCAALVFLRGLSPDIVAPSSGVESKPDSITNAAPHAVTNINANAKKVFDISVRYKPSAVLNTICGSERISRQILPLLYKAEGKDGLPTYYFAPANLN